MHYVQVIKVRAGSRHYGKGVPMTVPRKNEVLGHYLPFFVNFTHENDEVSNEKGTQLPCTPSGSAMEHFKYSFTQGNELVLQKI